MQTRLIVVCLLATLLLCVQSALIVWDTNKSLSSETFTVAAADTLFIAPGVDITLAGSTIKIQGTLASNGTALQKINFFLTQSSGFSVENGAKVNFAHTVIEQSTSTATIVLTGSNELRLESSELKRGYGIRAEGETDFVFIDTILPPDGRVTSLRRNFYAVRSVFSSIELIDSKTVTIENSKIYGITVGIIEKFTAKGNTFKANQGGIKIKNTNAQAVIRIIGNQFTNVDDALNLDTSGEIEVSDNSFEKFEYAVRAESKQSRLVVVRNNQFYDGSTVFESLGPFVEFVGNNVTLAVGTISLLPFGIGSTLIANNTFTNCAVIQNEQLIKILNYAKGDFPIPITVVGNTFKSIAASSAVDIKIVNAISVEVDVLRNTFIDNKAISLNVERSTPATEPSNRLKIRQNVFNNPGAAYEVVVKYPETPKQLKIDAAYNYWGFTQAANITARTQTPEITVEPFFLTSNVQDFSKNNIGGAPAAHSSSNKKSGLTGGQKAGIVIGVLAGVFILAIIVAALAGAIYYFVIYKPGAGESKEPKYSRHE